MEAQLAEILKLIARHGDPSKALHAVCAAVEQRLPDARASILLLDRGPGRLRHGAAPSLPAGYISAVDDIRIGPNAGSCGTAAFRNELVVVDDIETDPLWADYKEVALAHGLRACWSHPVRRPSGEVAGTIAIYHDTPRAPSRDEIETVRDFADLASVALEIYLTNEERHETAERMISLTSNLPGMVFQWQEGDDGKIRFPFVSDGAQSLIGLLPDAVMSKADSFIGRFDPVQRETLLAMFRLSVETMEPSARDVCYPHPSEGMKWLLIRSRPRRQMNGGLINDALALDISEHKAAEQSLERSRKELHEHLIELERTRTRQEAQSAMLMDTARELTLARDAAEEASRAKSQFLSNMSHELRTPLNAIIGFSEMIKEQTFGPIGSPKYRAYAMDIFESGRHLLELINEILDLAKAESGKDTLNENDFGIDELLEGAVRIVRSRAERDRVTLTVKLPDCPPVIRADKRKLRQVLINLITNAIKFTEAGGHVNISCWGGVESGIVFQITDDGIGIALEDIPKALGLFGQIDNVFSRKHEGTGLGLPLSKSLVELHGGSLDLQSQPGVGTTVTFRLPPERIVAEGGPQIAKAG
ncbi:MAG: GAF domain-containing protein [Alphaproteobacteria bacterium]|nr:GAF domain-containing protein [Alphaproteobacteria bacterium]